MQCMCTFCSYASRAWGRSIMASRLAGGGGELAVTATEYALPCAYRGPLLSGIATQGATLLLTMAMITCCVGKVYTCMSERGLAHGGLSDYYNTWYMCADRRGALLITEAIPWSQRSDPTRLSATEVGLQRIRTCPASECRAESCCGQHGVVFVSGARS